MDTNRTEKLSRKEFNTLPRYGQSGARLPCGRITDLESVFTQLTTSQVCDLGSEDWALYHDLVRDLMRTTAPDFDPENIYNSPLIRQSIEEDRR